MSKGTGARKEEKKKSLPKPSKKREQIKRLKRRLE